MELEVQEVLQALSGGADLPQGINRCVVLCEDWLAQRAQGVGLRLRLGGVGARRRRQRS